MPVAALVARTIPEGAPVPEVRRTARALALSCSDADPRGVVALALELAAAGRFHLACELLNEHRAAKAVLLPREVERLARGAEGWALVDQLACFITGPLWREGRLVDAQIQKWARLKNRWLRRLAVASTVPLNSRARGGAGDPARTLRICRMVIDDRDDMVVKALSWALRELSKRDRGAVETFLEEHEERLAARVRREVGHKLTTGLKSPRRGAAAARRAAPRR